jgi:hypothetical protein
VGPSGRTPKNKSQNCGTFFVTKIHAFSSHANHHNLTTFHHPKHHVSQPDFAKTPSKNTTSPRQKKTNSQTRIST